MLPPKIVKFVESQINLHAQKKKGQRYSNETKAFALSLYQLSGKAYKMISKLFCLPSKSSILKWVSKIPNHAGLNKSSIDVITSKVSTMSSTGKLCVISVDEISIKSHFTYDTSKDEIIGLEDFGNGEKTNCLATSAIVIMVRGIIENWKQPVAYYLVNESCGSDKIREKLVDAITKLENIGLQVLAVVSDIGTNFQKFVREMGITQDNPWFDHNGKKIFYIFDAPHIIKAVRNNLMNYEFHFDGKVARWKDIESLYQMDSKNSIRCCPKLTNNHVHPNGFSKMKVKLATQVLSHTVSAAMLMAVSGGLLPASASGTAELLAQFDQIFDCLNSSSFHTPKEANQPITSTSKHEQMMSKMKAFVQSIKVVDPKSKKDITSTLKCLKALEITLTSTMLLWKSIQGSVKFLCTRRLNQDPLENFFGCIRQQGGNSDSPTPQQFSRAFRKLFFNSYLLPMGTGNCAADLDELLVSSRAVINKESLTFQNSNSNRLPFEEIQECDYKSSSVEGNILNKNATTYVCGYLLKSALKRHNCPVCVKSLINRNLDTPDKLSCYFKAYDESKPFGGLTVPDDRLINYFNTIEQTLVDKFPNIISMPGIGKHFVLILPKFSLQECPQFPSEFMLKLFVRMRIFYVLKFGNRELTRSKNGKKNRKYFKVSHL